MTPKLSTLIKSFIPLAKNIRIEEQTEDWSSGGKFTFLKIDGTYFCLLEIYDYVVESFALKTVEAVENYFGLEVRGVIQPGTGELLRSEEKIIKDPRLQKDKKEYYLYALQTKH